MDFQIRSLPKALFDEMTGLSDEELASRLAMRVTATKKPGFPCRVSLADAEVGEELFLVNYKHHEAETPFQASHAIYVRTAADEASLSPGETPEMLRSRTLSLRGFDDAGMLVAADLTEGAVMEHALRKLLQAPGVAYAHIHFAKPGCFAARADWVDASDQSVS